MTDDLQEALRQSRVCGGIGPAIRAEGAEQLGLIGNAVAIDRLRELMHDDNYAVYVTVAEALARQGEAGQQALLTEAARQRPVGGMLWAEVALTAALSDGFDLRTWLLAERRGRGEVGAAGREPWDALWLDLDAADPGVRGRGVTPAEIQEDWTFVDWLRLSRVFLPLHAREAAAGLAALEDERAFRRLVQMAHGMNATPVEAACEALLDSGTDGVDVVLRLSKDCCELHLLDAIRLPIQWAIPGDLRAALTDRRDHAADPVVRSAAGDALTSFWFAMPPLPGEPPGEVEVMRLDGDPTPSTSEEIP